MKFNSQIPVYGDTSFRGKCPPESAEQATFFAEVRRLLPDTVGAVAIHPRNEQQLRGGQFNALKRHKAEGMVAGSSDIIIPGSPAFVCELKRQDHTKSRWQDGQVNYLLACQAMGCFVCVALGYKAALEALHEWLK